MKAIHACLLVFDTTGLIAVFLLLGARHRLCHSTHQTTEIIIFFGIISSLNLPNQLNISAGITSTL